MSPIDLLVELKGIRGGKFYNYVSFRVSYILGLRVTHHLPDHIF